MIPGPRALNDRIGDLAKECAALQALYVDRYPDMDLGITHDASGISDRTLGAVLDSRSQSIRAALRQASKALESAIQGLERANRGLRAAPRDPFPEDPSRWHQFNRPDLRYVDSVEAEEARQQRDKRVGKVRAKEFRNLEEGLSLVS